MTKPLISWDIFDFFFEISERNSPKLDREKEVYYQMCFSGRSENKIAVRPLIEWFIFDFSETAERNVLKLDRKQEFNVLYQVVLVR